MVLWIGGAEEGLGTSVAYVKVETSLQVPASHLVDLLCRSYVGNGHLIGSDANDRA